MPTLYLYVGIFLAGLCSGGYGVHTWYKAQQVDAIQEARTLERDGVKTANQADLDYINRLVKDKERADANASKWKGAFDQAANSLRHCAVSPELVRMLNEPRPEPAAGPAAQPEPAAAAPQAGADCAAVVDTYHWNIDNVIEPNAIQLEQLQRFYMDVQRMYNR